MKNFLIEKIIQISSELIRRIPFNRKIKGFFIRASMLLKDYHFNYEFRCSRINIRWSASGFPDLLTRHMMFEGMYQEDVLVALRHFVQKGDIVFDIGSHHGLMTVIAAIASGSTGKVVAFEPNPFVRTYTQKHIALNSLPNVIIEDIALSSRKGETSFFIQSGMVTWNSTIVEKFASQADTQITVPTTTLDNYVLDTRSIPRVIKIDTEGSEFMILEGAKETLRKYQPVLIMEFHPVAAQAAGTTISKYVEFLEGEGYNLVTLKKNMFGYYHFNNQEPFNEIRHTAGNNLINVVCIPSYLIH
jgi:FkbM family methyltransferase